MNVKRVILLFCIFSYYYTFSQNRSLFLIAGQSNAVGQGDATQSVVCQPETALEYIATTNDCVPLKDPVGESWKLFQKAGTGSIAPAFAKRFNELTGRKVYIVTAARGGASCNVKAEMSNYGTWDETGNNQLFIDAVTKMQMAVKKTATALSGILWMQGERDANAILNKQMTAYEYQQSLESVINRFRKKFGKNLPFYIVLTGNQTDKPTEGSLAVQNVQKNVAAKLKQVYIAYDQTPHFPEKRLLKDIVHYNQTALNEIGEKVAETIYDKSLSKGQKSKLESQRPH
jgi:hypothetical protein